MFRPRRRSGVPVTAAAPPLEGTLQGQLHGPGPSLTLFDRPALVSVASSWPVQTLLVPSRGRIPHKRSGPPRPFRRACSLRAKLAAPAATPRPPTLPVPWNGLVPMAPRRLRSAAGSLEGGETAPVKGTTVAKSSSSATGTPQKAIPNSGITPSNADQTTTRVVKPACVINGFRKKTKTS